MNSKILRTISYTTVMHNSSLHSACNTRNSGKALKMGQHNHCTCGTINQEATMPCSKCPNKSTSLIKTPHGYICPDCYKRIYVAPNSRVA